MVSHTIDYMGTYIARLKRLETHGNIGDVLNAISDELEVKEFI